MDSKDFDKLVTRHQDWLFRLAVRFCPNSDEARDAVQDVFLNIWRKRHNLPEMEESAIKAYLKSAVSNRCIDLFRSRKREPIVDLDPDITPAKNFASESYELVGKEQLLSILLICISELEEAKQREAILLRRADMKLAVIAHLLGYAKPSGVKRVLDNAIKALRQCFEQRLGHIGVV